MVEFMMVFVFIIAAIAVLLSYRNVVFMQEVNNDLRFEIVELHAKLGEVERDNQAIHEACDIIDEDLCLLGEAVDNYLEAFEPCWLDNLVSVMDDLEDKYGNVAEYLNERESLPENGGWTDEWIRHVDLRECDEDCPICLEAEQTPVNTTVH